jgi:hypothetical protein
LSRRTQLLLQDMWSWSQLTYSKQVTQPNQNKLSPPSFLVVTWPAFLNKNNKTNSRNSQKSKHILLSTCIFRLIIANISAEAARKRKKRNVFINVFYYFVVFFCSSQKCNDIIYIQVALQFIFKCNKMNLCKNILFF